MKHLVTPTTQRKRAEWERIFGTDQLPVTDANPALTPAGCLAWTLDTARLHWMAVERVVGWLARRDDLKSAHARALVMAGLPIPVSEASLVQETETRPSPVFVWKPFGWPVLELALSL